ncbi:MAG: hypothetical protein ACPGSM_08155 [Thiolinea sp.]
MSVAHHHVFIPGLFAPLTLWQRDFGFQPESPGLMRLLADYQQYQLPVTGLERGLLHHLGCDVAEQLPWSVLRHRFESGGMYQPPLLCADPVHLQSGSDAIVLNPVAPELSPAEAERIITDLNQHLEQDGLILKAFHPQRWYLHQLDERFSHSLPQTTPLPEVGNGNIFPALPQGGDKYWHQLLNEIQMLLHNHSINQAREHSGQLPVNGVWFWGEGDADTDGLRQTTSVQGGGVCGQVIAAAIKTPWQSNINSDIHAMPESGDVLMILDQLQSAVAVDQPQVWQQALDGLSEYFDYLYGVLHSGGNVSLYDTSGRIFACERVPGWQFWRPKNADWQQLIN